MYLNNVFLKIFLIIVTFLIFLNLYFEKFLINQQSKRLYSNESDDYNDSLSKYRLIHVNIMNGITKPVRVSVNGPASNGYANKLYSLITSLVVALLTDSALIIRWKDIDLYIEEPFFKSYHNFSSEKSDFNIEYDPSSVFVLHPRFIPWDKKIIDELIKTKLNENYRRFYIFSIYATFFEICSNPDYYDKLSEYGLVSNQTKQKALEITRNMSNYDDKVKKHFIFKVPFEVGGNLLNKVWVPKNHIMDKVNYYIKNYFNDYFVIGIQIRYEFIDLHKDLEIFIKCANEIESNLIVSSKKGIKWYLSTEGSFILDFLKKKYPDKIIAGDGKIGHVIFDPESYERAILDVELLSRCDELIITGGSTFGFVSAMKMLKLPYYIDGKKNETMCKRTNLGEPPRSPIGYTIF